MPKKVVSRKKLTRQEIRDLDIEIDFLEGVVRRDPKFIDALQVLGDDYTKRGKFPEGLGIDRELSKLRPEDPMIHYNLACSYSLTGETQLAIEALERAIDYGYKDFKWLSEDPDLEELRMHTAYRKIRAKIRNMRVKIG